MGVMQIELPDAHISHFDIICRHLRIFPLNDVELDFGQLNFISDINL